MLPEEKHIDVKSFLPHRNPMLMVDEVIHIDAKTVKTRYWIPEKGLFIRSGKLVEEGLIENLAQSCSSVVGQSYFVEENQRDKTKLIGFISGIKKVQMHQLPASGTWLYTEASLKSRLDTAEFVMCTMKAKSYVASNLSIEAEINLIIQELKA
ncbi:MAG: ABC transporter permease [Flavobacteriaceae bacterium]|nr:ABC transporter permease [Flavobacteriaceae bacterium]